MKPSMTPGGFTLIELLLALFILTLISVASYRGLNAVLQARERIAAQTVKWQHLAFFFSRVESDIAQAVHRPVRTCTDGVAAEWIGHDFISGKDDAELTFSRAGMPGQGSELSTPQRIAYRLEQNTIYMLLWPALDCAPASEPLRAALLTEVREFKVRHLDHNHLWQSQWPSIIPDAPLPEAVEMTIKLSDGDVLTRVFALQ